MQDQELKTVLDNLNCKMDGLEDRRRSTRNNLYIQAVIAIASIFGVCATIQDAFKSAIEQQNQTVIIQMKHIQDQIKKLESKAAKDNQQDIDIAINAQALKSLDLEFKRLLNNSR
jgi:hypothetical protein